MSNETNTINKEMLVDELARTINIVRTDELGLSLQEMSQIIANILAPEELDAFIVELLDRQIENHNLGKCLWCQNDLSQEDFDMHKGICKKCLEKEIEDKINTDFVERLKPDNENDF